MVVSQSRRSEGKTDQTIFFTNFPESFGKYALWKLFAFCGRVKDVFILGKKARWEKSSDGNHKMGKGGFIDVGKGLGVVVTEVEGTRGNHGRKDKATIVQYVNQEHERMGGEAFNKLENGDHDWKSCCCLKKGLCDELVKH
ncbi:hypothetical protein VNO78_08622 [Psophocarpus tetragonolobus]|uniref:RRM domain-containing protein n=1 Tax=Psophocarpus tetragonolobus TaxID=3891 RepID=A0AAN9SV55_PSOTE